MSEIVATDFPIELLSYSDYGSVKKYLFDLMEDKVPNEYKVSDNYFTQNHYPHNININYSVKLYTWDYNSETKSVSNLHQSYDISDKVIDISYECDSESDVNTTISLTLYVPETDDYWYLDREYDKRHGSYLLGSSTNAYWMPQIYNITRIIKYKDNENNDVVFNHNLGFYLPCNGGYTYDQTTSQLKLQLYGLSYQFTAEGGGVLITAIRTVSYWFDVPYNSSPTKIISYKLEETQKQGSTVVAGISMTPALPDEITYEKQELLQVEQKIYSGLNDSYNPLYVSGTAEVLPRETSGYNQINVPYPLSFDGYDSSTGALKIYDGQEITHMLYKIAMSYYDVIQNDFRLPLTGIEYPNQDSEPISKSEVFPNGWDFDNGSDIMSIAKTILNDKYYEPMLWVDENRRFCVDTVPPFPSRSRIGLYFRLYSELVISEDISIDSSNYYSTIEVYGKDSEYYGVYDTSILGFKTLIDELSLYYAKSFD